MTGSYFGFDVFSFMPLIFGLFFVAFFAVLGVIAIKSFRAWQFNASSPLLTVPAKVVTKRSSVSSSLGTDNVNHISSTYYFTTFELDSGERVEMPVKGREYGVLAEGDVGRLTFQGLKFLSFERKITI